MGRVGDAPGTVGVSVKAGTRYAAELDTSENYRCHFEYRLGGHKAVRCIPDSKLPVLVVNTGPDCKPPTLIMAAGN